MLINEVETVVGLSKKSIRYYEDVGLFKPKRTNSNEYRNYSNEDVLLLKKIKFLRDLDISINEIKMLTNKELTLKECMEDKIIKLSECERIYQKIKQMCEDISLSNYNYESLDIDKYSMEMNILNKEGFTISNNLSKDQTKKITGAIASSIIFILLFIFLIGLITYFQLTEEEKMPIALYIFVIGIFIVPLFGVITNLFIRIKEIKGGEEDEASKY